MPIYDPFEQRMTVRVVYDGVACAGKTTNLRQLCVLHASQQVSELQTPQEMHGRTLFFDWMQISAGVVCGFPLLCQIVSVPGQVVLTPRRRLLLANADVVVYVCESHESHVATASAGLELLDEIGRARGTPIPLVVQANKQDRPGAIDGRSLVRALGRESVPFVEAIASEGVGVVDTFVSAIRTVARAIQARSEESTLHVPVRRAESAAEVLARIARERIDPEWAAEMLLEEAQAAYVLQEALFAVTANAEARATAAAAAAEIVQKDAQPAAARDDASSVDAGPPVPSADVPTGFIWPAHTGRAVVRALALAPDTRVPLDEHDAAACATNDRIVRTSTRDRFADPEAARQALVRKARECTQLDRLLVPETVLVAQPAVDGACWIWIVRPRIPTIASQLTQPNPDLLGAYAAAVVEALRTSLRYGFSLAFTPESFGVDNSVVRYVGDVVSEPPRSELLSADLFAAVDALERAGADAKVFLDAFERELERRLTSEERARAGRLSDVFGRAVAVS